MTTPKPRPTYPLTSHLPATAFTLTDVCQKLGEVQVLDGINLELPAREFTALIGPSGSGKTSLLRLLNRLDEPTSGAISYDGKPIGEYPVRQYRRRVGFVFQTPIMFSGTVRDNLAVAAQLAAIPTAEVEERIATSMELAEVDRSLLQRDATHLSVGQKQRVGMARTFMTDPETLLLDEPTASLDPEIADKLMKTIGRFRVERGVTVVAATHRLTEAKKISGYVVMLEGGRVIEAGPTAEIFDRSINPRIRSFLDSMS